MLCILTLSNDYISTWIHHNYKIYIRKFSPQDILSTIFLTKVRQLMTSVFYLQSESPFCVYKPVIWKSKFSIHIELKTVRVRVIDTNPSTVSRSWAQKLISHPLRHSWAQVDIKWFICRESRKCFHINSSLSFAQMYVRSNLFFFL